MVGTEGEERRGERRREVLSKVTEPLQRCSGGRASAARKGLGNAAFGAGAMVDSPDKVGVDSIYTLG